MSRSYPQCVTSILKVRLNTESLSGNQANPILFNSDKSMKPCASTAFFSSMMKGFSTWFRSVIFMLKNKELSSSYDICCSAVYNAAFAGPLVVIAGSD